MSNSLKNKIKRQRSFINLSGNDHIIERPNVSISESHKRQVWKDIIKSVRATAHTSTTTILNTSNQPIGTKKHITLSLFTSQKSSSNLAIHIGQRTIERIDGEVNAVKDEIELEYGYEQYLEIAKTPFIEETNNSTEMVFVTSYVDPISGKSEGNYVAMSPEEAQKYHRKNSAETKAGEEYLSNLMADPENRAALAEFIAQKGAK
jgi:hypothetical protein